MSTTEALRELLALHDLKDSRAYDDIIDYQRRKPLALAAAPNPPAAVQPAAYVPVHPRNGPLWANTTADPSPERLPSYPLMALYGSPVAPEAVAQAESSELVIDGYRGEKGIRWYVAELHKVRFVNHWLADAYCNALQEVYERDFRGAGKDEQEARRLAANKIADVANASKVQSEKRFKENGDDDRIAALKALATPPARDAGLSLTSEQISMIWHKLPSGPESDIVRFARAILAAASTQGESRG